MRSPVAVVRENAHLPMTDFCSLCRAGETQAEEMWASLQRVVSEVRDWPGRSEKVQSTPSLKLLTCQSPLSHITTVSPGHSSSFIGRNNKRPDKITFQTDFFLLLEVWELFLRPQKVTRPNAYSFCGCGPDQTVLLWFFESSWLEASAAHQLNFFLQCLLVNWHDHFSKSLCPLNFTSVSTNRLLGWGLSSVCHSGESPQKRASKFFLIGHKGHCPLIGSDTPLWHARGQSEVSVCLCVYMRGVVCVYVCFQGCLASSSPM